jgi:hypothetical protein
MPRATAGVPPTKNGTSERCRDRHEARSGQRQFPQPVERQQRAGRIRAAATQAAADRDALVHRQLDTEARSAFQLQRLCGANRQIVGGGNPRHIVGAHDGTIVAPAQRDGIGKVNHREQRFQRVIAVGAPPRHMEKEIDLGGGRDNQHGGRCGHGALASFQRSTTSRTSTISVSG